MATKFLGHLLLSEPISSLCLKKEGLTFPVPYKINLLYPIIGFLSVLLTLL